MLKLFGVGDDDQRDDSQNDEDIHVSIHENEQELTQAQPVGQIALDVLENHESVYILAPVAGIELHDIDIAVHETTLTIS
jgi:HSP20 family molecular chaperone IbpA